MVGNCTDTHVRRGGNFAYIYCELIIPFAWYLLLCVYSTNLHSCRVKLQIDLKFWNMCSVVRGSKTVVETK